MKNGIHPQYHVAAKVSCSCGNAFTTGSTVAELHTEVCSLCHPFYTGKQKMLDTAGVVDKFKKRTAMAVEKKAAVTVKKPRKVRGEKK